MEKWFNTNLKNYESKIADGKYCNDRNTKSGQSWSSAPNNSFYYVPLERRNVNAPTLSCYENDIYTLKIGFITLDEVIYAGANFEKENKSYYLYNSKIENVWWTSSLAKASATVFYPFSVNSNGKVEYATSGMLYRNLRPTINLIRNTVVSGNGTKDNPYEIKI